MSASDKNSAKEGAGIVGVNDAASDAGSSGGSSGRVDTAWKYLDANRDVGGDTDSEPIDLAALRRKIDWHIVPLMFLCYTLQFLDKVILNVRGCPFHPHRHPTASG
jgi:hypothetical protein